MANPLTVPTGSYPLSGSASNMSMLSDPLNDQSKKESYQTFEAVLQALKILLDTPNTRQSREDRHHKKQAELDPAVRNIEKSLSCRMVSPVTDPGESYPFLGPASHMARLPQLLPEDHCKMVSPVTDPGESYPFLLGSASHMAPLPQLLPEDHSSYAWQSTLLNHAEDCPVPQRRREDYQTCKADEKPAKVKGKHRRTFEINGQTLQELSDDPYAKKRREQALKILEDCPDLQRRRGDYQNHIIDGKTVEMKLLSNTTNARRNRVYRWRKANRIKLPPRKYSRNPAAKRARAYRLSKKKEKAEAGKGRSD